MFHQAHHIQRIFYSKLTFLSAGFLPSKTQSYFSSYFFKLRAEKTKLNMFSSFFPIAVCQAQRIVAILQHCCRIFKSKCLVPVFETFWGYFYWNWTHDANLYAFTSYIGSDQTFLIDKPFQLPFETFSFEPKDYFGLTLFHTTTFFLEIFSCVRYHRKCNKIERTSWKFRFSKL